MLSSALLLCYNSWVMSYEVGTHVDLRYLNKKVAPQQQPKASFMAVAVEGYEGLRFKFKYARRIPVVYIT